MTELREVYDPSNTPRLLQVLFLAIETRPVNNHDDHMLVIIIHQLLSMNRSVGVDEKAHPKIVLSEYSHVFRQLHIRAKMCIEHFLLCVKQLLGTTHAFTLF